MLPAIEYLDLFVIIPSSEKEGDPLTLGDIVIVAPLIALTFIAVRNLPGLLETSLFAKIATGQRGSICDQDAQQLRDALRGRNVIGQRLGNTMGKHSMARSGIRRRPRFWIARRSSPTSSAGSSCCSSNRCELETSLPLMVRPASYHEFG